jgi:hypothetical protein
MNRVSFLMRRCFVACVAISMIAGCAGSQMQSTPPAPMLPNLASIGISPMAADCPIVGKTYTRGGANGQASMKFQEAYAKVGTFPTRVRTRLVYTHWPENRPIIYRNLKMSTCGPESGKSPVGQAREGGGSSRFECFNGVCTITLDIEISYKPPATLPGGKKWKFDLIRFAPDKPIKGFEALPSYRIIVTR